MAATARTGQAGLTLAEAAGYLDPPVTVEQLREIIHALRIVPNGQRYTGRRGRPEDTFSAREIIKLHTALAPWLTRVLSAQAWRGRSAAKGAHPLDNI